MTTDRTTPEDDADALPDVLSRIQRLIRRRMRSTMVEPPPRGAQVELLRVVVARPGIRVSEAAKRLYLADNSVSTLVNQLSRAGFLTRERDPDDGRSMLLRPTSTAESRLREWTRHRDALVHAEVARLSEADRAVLAAAVPALRRLARRLHEEG